MTTPKHIVESTIREIVYQMDGPFTRNDIQERWPRDDEYVPPTTHTISVRLKQLERFGRIKPVCKRSGKQTLYHRIADPEVKRSEAESRWLKFRENPKAFLESM